ncbi:hypothetical protein VMCG_08215 [Cytospora schulzeri]|uniref:Heme oxygenase-like protein n=1 Tax=Cytospora schulzeri TaxID=448051 RepID=A0A423VSI8_9PEZI|nr:hypothetical protein VMCG_08215 [Valsa malicola]
MADTKTASLDGASKSLAHSINVAISSSHTKINRLILDRMPRAVPPQTDNPSTYITGLLHFGAVYIAFESLWQNILGIHTQIAPIPYTYPFSSDPNRRDETPQITERTRHILETMYWPSMLRYARVKDDIRTMTGWPQHVVDEQIRSVGTTGRLAKFLAHIQESVNQKPHLLLAYAYGLYLALLSGGSYIRTELMYLKAGFWQATPTPIRPNMIPCSREAASSSPFQKLERHESLDSDSSDHSLTSNDASFSKMPLEFLDFDPPLGENPRQQAKDLKAEFKRRFTDAEQALTEPERRDIVRESVAIFQHLEEVVGQLDRICDTPQVKGHVARVLHSSSPPQTHARTTNLGARLRDSIAVAKGRLLRTRRKSSGDSSVTATAPLLATEVVTMSADPSSSKVDSKVSSLSSSLSSSSPGEFQDAQSKQQSSQGSDLAHDAVLPGEGFRTIRYDNDDPEKLHGGLDGAAYDDIRRFSSGCCPIARVSSAKASTTAIVEREGPNYALYAMISNLIVLVGIGMVFMAYLYARHGDILAANTLDLRLDRDW